MASIWRTTHPASWSQKNLLHLEICDSSPSARGGHSTCLVCSLACLSTDPELAAVTPDFAIEFDDDACPAQQCYSGLIGPCRFSRSNRKHNRPLIAPCTRGHPTTSDGYPTITGWLSAFADEGQPTARLSPS